VFCEADPATDLVQVTEGCLRRYRILPDGRRAITGFAFPGDVLGSASPGVVVYKGYKETETGVLLETFPLSGTQLSPADASSFFRLDWEDLKGLMSRLNVSGTN
jgi:hypothetical protein